MPTYDDWNRIDEDDEDLQDTSFEGKRDVILFCINCSESMLKLYDDPKYEDEVKTCHFYAALEAAMQIQKRKVIVGPNDSVGILLFNTAGNSETLSQPQVEGSEIKKNTLLLQHITPIDAISIQGLGKQLDAFRENPDEMELKFPPLKGKSMPMGDVFTSCNWVIRDGAPKTATKRIFLITDEDNPHPGPSSDKLITSAKTTLIDLAQAGVTLEPFFISTPEKLFDVTKFYSSVLPLADIAGDDESDPSSGILPESISVTRIDELLAQMRFHEVPKRALFTAPFQLASDFVIGVKGYGLVAEQKRGPYKYFVDLGEGMEAVNLRTGYVDEDREVEVEKSKVLYGMSLGENPAPDDEGEGDDVTGVGARVVQAGERPAYTAEEIRSFRTLGLDPVIKLLGFKNHADLRFEDNIKHSYFIYPDELKYSGSKRTFSALLNRMLNKGKIGLVLALMRRNASPIFCALLPQAEKIDDGGWVEPAGFHLIPLPFADDIRATPIEEASRASDKVRNAARAWINKLCIKAGGYPPDSYPNPALAHHNAQLEATAFRGENYDPDTFEDLTLPKLDMIHKRAGKLITAWKEAIANDKSSHVVIISSQTKRKADTVVDDAEIRARHQSGDLGKLRVDQLKDFLKRNSQPTAGKKGELVDRVEGYLDTSSQI